MPPAPLLADEPAPTPVFVDDSGRRHRAVRVLGWCLGAVMVAYLALLGISLVGSPGLVPLSLPSLGQVLPGPAAPLIADSGHSPASTGDLVSTAVPSSAPATPAGAAPAPLTTTSTIRPRATTRTVITATPRPTATPTTSPSPTQSAQPTPQATTQSTHRPSTHPSPRSTRRSVPLASPSPTPTAT
jgi:hypothetical protein